MLFSSKHKISAVAYILISDVGYLKFEENVSL